MSERAATGIDRRLVAGVTVAGGAAVFVAALALPWATFEDLATGATIEFQGGPVSVAVTVLAIAAIGLSIIQVRRPSGAAVIGQAAVAILLLLASIALALSKVSDANATPSLSPSETGYGLGAVVGLLGSLVVLAASMLAVFLRMGQRPSA